MNIWTDIDEAQPKAKRAAGRPVENPFCSAQSEEDFVRRGEAMIVRYHRPGGPNKKHDFVFSPNRDMSKTLFWSIIFLYLVKTKAIRNNLQGYLNAILEHFGPQICSDRTSVCKSVGLMNRLSAQYTNIDNLEGKEGEKQAKYRSMYKYVVNRWKEAVPDASASDSADRQMTN